LYSDTFDALVSDVKRLSATDSEGYKEHPKTRLLRRIVDLIETEIPERCPPLRA